MIHSDELGEAQSGPLERKDHDGQLFAANGLTRREVVVLLSSVAMGLAGCSSGTTTGPPPPPPPTGLSPVTGTVSLPVGSGLSLNSLSLKTMGQTVALGSAATFSAGVSPNAPTLALVTDANGNGIMAGFLDPTIPGSQPITPRSTGVVLTWFAIGGPFLPATVKSQILALLNADPAMDTLGGVVAQRIASSPLAIVNGDAQVASALNTALDALIAGAARTVSGAAHLEDPPTLTVTPVTDQSGVSVRPDPTIVGVKISNSYRRPVKAYVYETQTQTAGTTTDISPARLVAGPISLGEPTTFTTITELKSFLLEPVPFKAFTIDPIPLALDGASDQTTFEVVILGPSSKGVVPSFFSATRYANQVPVWNGAIDAMFARTYFCDLVYATLLEMTGFGSILQTSPNLDVAGLATKSFAGNPFPGTPALPPAKTVFLSQFNATMASMLNDAGLADQYHGIAPTIMDSVGAQALQQMSTTDWRTGVNTAGNFVLKLSGSLLGLKSGNVGKLFDDLNNADRGVLWTALLSKSLVTITPPDPSFLPGDEVALTVVLSPDLTSTYEFDWSSDSQDATFSAVGEVNTGKAINTRQATVNLITTSDDKNPIGVQVLVFDVAGGHKAQVAKTGVTVSVLPKTTITPVVKGLAIGKQQTFTVTVDASLPAGVQYIWTLTGTAGSIGVTNLVTTTVPTLVYTAIRKGTDTLNVQVADANNKLLGKASAQINVDPDEFIQFSITGPWDPLSTPPDGNYPKYTDFLGGRVPNAGGPGLDVLAAQFDHTPTIPGVLLSIDVQPGAFLSQGQTFSKVPSGSFPVPGQWNLLLSTDLDHPDDPNSSQRNPVGTGILTIDSVEPLSDGNYLVGYSFEIDNGGGGIISGSGAATWK
jgi:hypothetical protein